MAHYFTAFEGEDDAKSAVSLPSTAASTAPSFLARRNWPKAPVSKAEADHHRALAIRKAQNAGGQGGKGKGKGKVENWRTEMQVFKDEVDDKYRARGILLGKGGENLRHISEETGLRIILEGEVPNAMQLVVVGPMPHVPALKKMRDLVEYVNDDYKQWAAHKPARHAHKQGSEASVAAAKRAAEKAEPKKAAEEAAAKKATDEAAAAKRAAEKAEAKKAAEEAAAKKTAEESAAAKRAAEKAEAKKAAEEAAAKKAAEESAAAKRAAEKAEAKKAAEEAAAKKAADEAAAAKRAAEKAEEKKAAEEAAVEKAAEQAAAMPASPVWSAHAKVQEPKLKDMIAIIREHLDFEDSCTTPAEIIAEANRQLGVQATGNIFQQARFLLSQLTEPW